MSFEDEIRQQIREDDRPRWYDGLLRVYGGIAGWADAAHDRVSNGFNDLLAKMGLTKPTPKGWGR